MSYINLSSLDKKNRCAQISTDIGTSGLLTIYTGTQPASPDLTATGTLLVSMPLSATAGVASYCLQSATITAAGSGGSNGAVTLTGVNGTGTKFQIAGTIAGGVLTALGAVTVVGVYSVVPANLNAEAVTGGSLTGCTLALNMTSQLTFNAVTQTNAAATGTAGYARVSTSSVAVGVVDLDCGTSGTSVILNTTAIVSAGPVIVSSAVLTEA